MSGHVRDALAICVQVGQPVLLWGSPGEGKTRVISQVAWQLGRPCEVVIGSVREASDFAGLPMRTDDGVTFAPPRWARRCVDDAPDTVVFLDELTTAAPIVQAAMLRVVLDREVGDLTLPESVSIVAAANPPEVSAGGDELSAPLANRFCHLSWAADLDSWLGGFVTGWPAPEVPIVPDDYRAEIGRWKGIVAGFLRAKPSLLRQVPDSFAGQGGAWPSPRTWDVAHRLAAAADGAGAGREVVGVLVKGCVGRGAGLELLSYAAQLDLPDPEALLADPDGLELPERSDRLLAVLGSVTAAVAMHCTRERWEAAWKVLGGAADARRADVAAVSATELLRLRDESWSPPPAVRSFLPVLRQSGLL